MKSAVEMAGRCLAIRASLNQRGPRRYWLQSTRSYQPSALQKTSGKFILREIQNTLYTSFLMSS